MKVLAEAGLKIQLHPNGTAIEGEWQPVFAAIEACHQALHAMGCPRIYTTVTINTRTDKEQTLADKVASEVLEFWFGQSRPASGLPRTRPLMPSCGNGSWA